jgi:hypothetical protein
VRYLDQASNQRLSGRLCQHWLGRNARRFRRLAERLQEGWIEKLRNPEGHAWQRRVQSINFIASQRITLAPAPSHRLVDDGDDQRCETVPAIFQRSLQELDNCRPLTPSTPELTDTGLGSSKRKSSPPISLRPDALKSAQVGANPHKTNHLLRA